MWDIIADLILLEIWDRLERLLPRPIRIGCYTVMVSVLIGIFGLVAWQWGH